MLPENEIRELRKTLLGNLGKERYKLRQLEKWLSDPEKRSSCAEDMVSTLLEILKIVTEISILNQVLEINTGLKLRAREV